MNDLIKNSKIVFNHENARGNFTVEITELKTETREAYRDIRIEFSINVKNEDNPDWRIKFYDVRGRISKIEDKEKLIEKLKDEIKIRINEDDQGDFNIGELTLDLTK